MSNPSVYIGGQRRVLACLPPHKNFGSLPKFLSDPKNKIIPRDQWKPVDWSSLGVPVLDQGEHGSCVGHGSTSAFWFKWLMDGGTVPPSGFSPTSLYALINGGRDQGAVVSDAMTALQEDGICTMAECPESTIFLRNIPDSAKQTRLRFKAEAAFHVSSFDEIGSAVQLGYPVSFGITIRTPFQSPPKDGIIPSGGWPIGGHCMMIYGCDIGSDGKPLMLVRNSWGTSWGLSGDCKLGEGHFLGRDLDAFAIGSVKPDPQDPNRPPVLH